MMTITVTCYLWAPPRGDHSFTCGASCPPPHGFTSILYICHAKAM